MTTANLKIIRLRLEDDRKRLVEQLEQIRANRSSEDRREGSPFGKREEEAMEVDRKQAQTLIRQHAVRQNRIKPA